MASKGHDVVLMYHDDTQNKWTQFAGGKSCEYKISRDMQEVSSPDTGEAKVYVPKRYSWTMTCKCILTGSYPRQTLFEMFQNKTLLTVGFFDTMKEENVTGTAYIKDLSESDAIHDLSAFNFTLQGTGVLTYTNND